MKTSQTGFLGASLKSITELFTAAEKVGGMEEVGRYADSMWFSYEWSVEKSVKKCRELYGKIDFSFVIESDTACFFYMAVVRATY